MELCVNMCVGVIIYAEPNVNTLLGNRQMRVESTVFLDVATHRQEKHAWNKHFGVILVTFIK